MPTTRDERNDALNRARHCLNATARAIPRGEPLLTGLAPIVRAYLATLNHVLGPEEEATFDHDAGVPDECGCEPGAWRAEDVAPLQHASVRPAWATASDGLRHGPGEC